MNHNDFKNTKKVLHTKEEKEREEEEKINGWMTKVRK